MIRCCVPIIDTRVADTMLGAAQGAAVYSLLGMNPVVGACAVGGTVAGNHLIRHFFGSENIKKLELDSNTISFTRARSIGEIKIGRIYIGEIYLWSPINFETLYIYGASMYLTLKIMELAGLILSVPTPIILVCLFTALLPAIKWVANKTYEFSTPVEPRRH